MVTYHRHRTDKANDAPRRRAGRGAVRGWAVWTAALLPPGCDAARGPVQDQPRWSFPLVQRVAVAPVLNFSGEESLDPVVVADLLASELTQAGGVAVVPVNRVVAALARSGSLHVRSPAHALEVCRAVGSDGILVPAVTEYDPYAPMAVGLSMELYVLPEFRGDPDRAAGPEAVPVAQLQRVFDAARQGVTDQVRAFARRRDAGAGPFGWRRYLSTQEGYLRFCFAEALQMLFGGQSDRMMLAQTTDGEE